MKRSLLIKVIIVLICLLVLFLLSTLQEGYEEGSNESSSIPLNLFQTWETKDLPPKMKELTETVQRENPEFNYQLFDASERAEFIRTHFDPDVLDAYETLVPGAYKADLWRYCVLYIHGGIYMDIKLEPEDDFRFKSIIDKEHFVVCRTDRQVWNAFMVCYPSNDKMLKCIRQIVENVRNEFYGDSPLATTGPFLLASFFTDEEIAGFDMELHTQLYENVETDFITILTEDGNKKSIIRKNNTIHSEQKSSTKHYSELWSERSIFKK